MTDDTERDAAGRAAATKREGQGAGGRPDDVSHVDRGTTLGRYIVVDKVGEGGMGVVYSAFDPELDRKVAIKLLQISDDDAMSAGEQALLLREAQALARLAHPNVVGVHDVGSLPGDRVFVAMELVDGLTLRAWLRDRKRGWREVIAMLIDAGKGLAAAHAAGLVHRDFKPDNVIVGKDGRARVMDFGLARLRPADEAEPAGRASDLNIEGKSPLSENLTVAGTVVGTPAYMAPEIYREKPANAASDQFSFGVTLFEALFGARPFKRDELRWEPPPRPKVPSETHVPARIQRAVLRAISPDPAQRFASMDALLAELAIDPHATRRRIMLAAGAVVLAASAAGAVFMARSGPAPCQGIEQRLAGVWDPAIKKKVSDAFAATKMAYAASAFAELGRSFDAYTKEWTATAVDSCRATRVRRDQSEEVLTLRQACLDQRLDELRALAQLLTEPDATIVDKADKLAGQLEPLAVCSNIALLRAPALPPPEVQAKLQPVGRSLADARANLITGRYVAGMAAAQKSIDLAKSADAACLRSSAATHRCATDGMVAEGMLVRGLAFVGMGQTQQASAVYHDTTWLALRGKRDDLAVPAAIMMAMLTADVAAKPEEARIWLELADSIAVRAGLDRVFEQKHDTALGVIEARANNSDAAVAAHEKALTIAQRGDPDSAGLWGDELMLATTLIKAQAYAKAIGHFEHALARREKVVGPDHADISIILTNLGAAYDKLGQRDKARGAFARAIAIREKAFGPQSPMMITTLNNLADMLSHEKDYPAALELVDRALAIAEKMPGPEHPLYHTVATTRAEILGGMGKTADARKLFDDTLALELKTHSNMLPITLQSRATLELAQQRWVDAGHFADQALAELEKTGGKDSSELFSPLVLLAQAKIGAHDTAAARPLLERAIAIGQKAGLGDAELDRARKPLAELR